MPQPGGRGEFDVDDDVRASTLTADAREQMVNDFGEAKPFVGLANFGQVRTAAGNPPPALVALERARKRAKAKENREAKAAAKAAAAEAADHTAHILT